MPQVRQLVLVVVGPVPLLAEAMKASRKVSPVHILPARVFTSRGAAEWVAALVLTNGVVVSCPWINLTYITS